MTRLNVPLAVRVQTSRTDRHITAAVRDLEFRSSANGGFASCGVKLDYPLDVHPVEIEQFGRLYVYDRRNGRTIWEGRQEDPGRSVSTAGQIWDLEAVGLATHVQDRTEPYIVVDTDLKAPVRANNVLPGGRDSVADDPGLSGVDAIILQFPSGTPITPSSLVAVRYSRIADAAQKLARVAYTWDAGRTDANFQVEALTRQGAGGSPTAAASANWNTAGGTAALVVVTNWTAGHNMVDLQIESDTTGTPVTDDHWASIRNLAIRAMLYSANGVERTTGYTSNTVLASEVVADLLGRWLDQFDGATADIVATTFPITQLAYPDGVDAGQVLDDLIVLEPAFRWAAWESNMYATSVALADLKARFEWTAWPTTPRYEYTVRDGFNGPGSAADIYNRVGVRYRRPDGAIVVAESTQTVASLDAAGLIRKAFLDLGDDVGSAANAAQAGAQFLAEHRVPPNAGSLTVAGPVIDNSTGRRVMPWEILPGYLIRVRGVLPHVDALNPDGRDGVTIYKINDVAYRASTAVAELGLDSYPLSVVRALADLRRTQPTAGKTRRR